VIGAALAFGNYVLCCALEKLGLARANVMFGGKDVQFGLPHGRAAIVATEILLLGRKISEMYNGFCI
jgi:hypothetical protein